MKTIGICMCCVMFLVVCMVGGTISFFHTHTLVMDPHNHNWALVGPADGTFDDRAEMLVVRIANNW